MHPRLPRLFTATTATVAMAAAMVLAAGAPAFAATSPTNGDSSLAQAFTGPTGGATLAVWYSITCPDTLTFDWATITLRDHDQRHHHGAAQDLHQRGRLGPGHRERRRR